VFPPSAPRLRLLHSPSSILHSVFPLTPSNPPKRRFSPLGTRVTIITPPSPKTSFQTALHKYIRIRLYALMPSVPLHLCRSAPIFLLNSLDIELAIWYNVYQTNENWITTSKPPIHRAQNQSFSPISTHGGTNIEDPDPSGVNITDPPVAESIMKSEAIIIAIKPQIYALRTSPIGIPTSRPRRRVVLNLCHFDFDVVSDSSPERSRRIGVRISDFSPPGCPAPPAYRSALVENPLQIRLSMQNKPNLQNPKMGARLGRCKEMKDLLLFVR